MAQLAIKGHATSGKEVIELLEMLGGKNIYKYNGNYDSLYYYIGKNNIIYYCHNCKGSTIFTLEKFLKKFPYKVWDKVKYRNNIFNIKSSQWDSEKNTVIYYIDADWSAGYVVEIDDLQPIIKVDMNTENVKNNIVDFIEQFCYIKDKKTNIYRPIKLSNLQKKFIDRLNKNMYGKISDKRSRNSW